MANNQFQESVYERVKRRKCATVSSLNEACDAAVALSEEDGKDVTIFITPPDENDDTDKDSAGEEEANPGTVHFSRNILEAEAETEVNEADNETLNKKQHKYKWREGNNIRSPMKSQKMKYYEVPENDNLNLYKQWTPVEAAELFLFSNDVLEMIKTYTIKYANKKLNFIFDVTIDELKVFFLNYLIEWLCEML